MQVTKINLKYNFISQDKNKKSFTTDSFSPINFKGLPTDTFAKEARNVYSNTELLKILSGDFRKLTKKFFDSLSPEEWKYCLSWAKADEKKFSGMVQYTPESVLLEDVKDLVSYGDFYYQGLSKIAKKHNKDMHDILVVGIGQSPVATIKLLELIGVNTACCPISGLSQFNESIEKYVTPQNIEKYFSHWKEFGFDVNDLFSDKLIIFTDYKEKGTTLKLFKEIIDRIKNFKRAEKKGEPQAILEYKSLNELFAASHKDKKDKIWGTEFEDAVFHTSYLKTLYSPLFKLPLQKIHEIFERHKLSQNSDRYLRFNRFTVLLYDELYHHPNYNFPKRFATLENQRKFRLSFYTPDE